MAFENYTIRQFMNAWFKKDYSIISEEELEVIKTEYVAVAKLYSEEEFEKVSYINFINHRINTVNVFIKLQRDFVKEFGCAYSPAFLFLRKFGHYVKWEGDKEAFLKTLEQMELKEKFYVSELENCIKELKDFQGKKHKKKESTLEESRASMVKTINSLGKVGYKIDKDSTTVEEFAFMIAEQVEESQNIKHNFNVR